MHVPVAEVIEALAGQPWSAQGGVHDLTHHPTLPPYVLDHRVGLIELAQPGVNRILLGPLYLPRRVLLRPWLVQNVAADLVVRVQDQGGNLVVRATCPHQLTQDTPQRFRAAAVAGRVVRVVPVDNQRFHPVAHPTG